MTHRAGIIFDHNALIGSSQDGSIYREMHSRWPHVITKNVLFNPACHILVASGCAARSPRVVVVKCSWQSLFAQFSDSDTYASWHQQPLGPCHFPSKRFKSVDRGGMLASSNVHTNPSNPSMLMCSIV